MHWSLCANAQEQSALGKLDAKHLPNAIQVREGLISGGLPETEAAFEELKRLGVQTIISVDGAKPDVEMAQRYAMRYVHIPHGYDGISEPALQALTKAAYELPGPIYIHCHHGKHRSPAAAAALCVSQGTMQVSEALGVLKLAGTDPSYQGLFQAVQKAKRMDRDELAKLPIDFPSVREMPPLIDSMIELNETFSRLSKVASANWKPSPESSSIDVPHDSVLLREHFEEMQRLEDVAKYPSDFRRFLQESERAAWFIETMLNPPLDESRPVGQSSLSKLRPAQRKAIDLNWKTIRTHCTNCHQQFRN